MMFSETREWQLWMHPYPVMVKSRKRQKVLRGGGVVRLSDLVEGQKKTSPLLKRCVRAVALRYDGDMKKAFAICIAQMQKSGLIKVGGKEPTKAGVRAGRRKAAEKGHSSKVADYEDLLALNRRGK